MTTYEFTDVALISDLTDTAQQSLTSDSADRVGRVFHESLLNALRKGKEPLGQMFAVTESRVLLFSINARTHEERAALARDAGRAFTAAAIQEDELIRFIGNTSVGTYHTSGSDVAITFVEDLSQFNDANNRDQIADAMIAHETRVFLDEVRKGIVIATHNDGDLCVPADAYQELSAEERVGKSTAVNNLMFETLIGAVPSVPFYRAETIG